MAYDMKMIIKTNVYPVSRITKKYGQDSSRKTEYRHSQSYSSNATSSFSGATRQILSGIRITSGIITYFSRKDA